MSLTFALAKNCFAAQMAAANARTRALGPLSAGLAPYCARSKQHHSPQSYARGITHQRPLVGNPRPGVGENPFRRRGETRCSASAPSASRDTSPVVFRQLFDAEYGSSTYTYLLGCPATKKAVLIDPVLELVERDLSVVEQLGLELVYAINTHCHADHITGTGEIKKRLPSVRSGISSAAGAKADILYSDGHVIEVGELRLHVLSTPGHTSGCVSYHMESDGSHDGMVFTGDALLIRGCGRTDFQEGNASQLYSSVHSKLFSLPPTTKVFPAHDYKGMTSSTISEEMKFNPRLSKPEEEFITIMDNLNLSYPKKIDDALPANLVCGLQD